MRVVLETRRDWPLGASDSDRTGRRDRQPDKQQARQQQESAGRQALRRSRNGRRETWLTSVCREASPLSLASRPFLVARAASSASSASSLRLRCHRARDSSVTVESCLRHAPTNFQYRHHRQHHHRRFCCWSIVIAHPLSSLCVRTRYTRRARPHVRCIRIRHHAPGSRRSSFPSLSYHSILQCAVRWRLISLSATRRDSTPVSRLSLSSVASGRG